MACLLSASHGSPGSLQHGLAQASNPCSSLASGWGRAALGANPLWAVKALKPLGPMCPYPMMGADLEASEGSTSTCIPSPDSSSSIPALPLASPRPSERRGAQPEPGSAFPRWIFRFPIPLLPAPAAVLHRCYVMDLSKTLLEARIKLPLPISSWWFTQWRIPGDPRAPLPCGDSTAHPNHITLIQLIFIHLTFGKLLPDFQSTGCLQWALSFLSFPGSALYGQQTAPNPLGNSSLKSPNIVIDLIELKRRELGSEWAGQGVGGHGWMQPPWVSRAWSPAAPTQTGASSRS